jgi:hypothetical protein
VFAASVTRVITLIMEAASTFEMANFYQTTWHNNPEDSNLHTHQCQNLKSHNWYAHYCQMRNNTLMINNVIVMVWEDDSVNCFTLLSRHLLEQIEKTTKNLRTVRFQQRFKPETTWIQSQTLTSNIFQKTFHDDSGNIKGAKVYICWCHILKTGKSIQTCKRMKMAEIL